MRTHAKMKALTWPPFSRGVPNTYTHSTKAPHYTAIARLPCFTAPYQAGLMGKEAWPFLLSPAKEAHKKKKHIQYRCTRNFPP